MIDILTRDEKTFTNYVYGIEMTAVYNCDRDSVAQKRPVSCTRVVGNR